MKNKRGNSLITVILAAIVLISAFCLLNPTQKAPAVDTTNTTNTTDATNTTNTTTGGETTNSGKKEETENKQETVSGITEDGTYTSKEEVAEYLNKFGHLPSNFITKNEAKKLGWDEGKGTEYVGKVAPGKSIGGDKFGNYEGKLPKESGRTYKECDIDYGGQKRNAKRIVFSNDGLVYYTEDHYETFELLYGEP